MGRFFDELKRRNVVRIAIAYIIIGWLTFQLGEIVLPTFGAPEWVFKTIIFLVVLGFPFILLFAWAFEVTPEGVKKTRDVSAATSITANTGRKIDFVIIAALVVGLGYFVWDSQGFDEESAEVSSTSGPDAEVEEVAETTTLTRSIAVLPFVNMSADEEQEWFADGLTEEILNSLARTPDLLVAARTSSFAFKGSNQDISDIAEQLGVDHVLEGSVRRGGDRLRVTAQLIRASDGFHLWSETFDRGLDDVIEIQENVAVEIANALETALDPQALADMMSAGTRSVAAYEAYLQGLSYGFELGRTGDMFEYQGLRTSMERALEIDPQFAKAYWELAQFYSEMLGTANISYGTLEYDESELGVLFEDAITNAIRFERDETSKLLYQATQATTESRLGHAYRLTSEYLEKRPNDLLAVTSLLSLQAMLGYYDEIEALIADIATREIRDGYVYGQVMLSALSVNDPELIRKHANIALERMPDDIFVRYQAHRALLWAGDIDGASRLLPSLQLSEFPESVRALVNVRQACAEKDKQEVDKLFASFDAFADDRFMLWIRHKYKGEHEQAAELLMEIDHARNFRVIKDYLPYPFFDSSRLPNTSAMLEAEGARPQPVAEIPYGCP